MPFTQTELNRESLDSNNLPQKVDCDTCGTSATLRTTFLYRRQIGIEEQPDHQSPPPVVMALHCPVCGPRTQIKVGNFQVGR